MLQMTCNCGATTMNFHRLTEKAFPNGWENDCCEEAIKNAPKMDVEEPIPTEFVKAMLDEKVLDQYFEASEELEKPFLEEVKVLDGALESKKDKKNKYNYNKGKK